jgi:hypothetical protein
LFVRDPCLLFQSSTCHAKEKPRKFRGIINSIFLNAQNIAGQTEVLVPFGQRETLGDLHLTSSKDDAVWRNGNTPKNGVAGDG